ncbi:MAG TPA: hypothetical protein VHE35_35500, partial [Kofleriaceae bacterium]|nr:hypothetical protein [Kofleriaceae bacterium]
MATPPTYTFDLAGARRFLLPLSDTRLAGALHTLQTLQAADESALKLEAAPTGAPGEILRLHAPDRAGVQAERCLPTFGFLVGGGLAGNAPDVRFERRGDEVYLVATLVEVRDARPKHLDVEVQPLQVTIDAVTLRAPQLSLAFKVVVENGDPLAGPSQQMRIEARLHSVADGAVAPGEVSVDDAIGAMQARGAQIFVDTSFRWRLVQPAAPEPQPPHPVPHPPPPHPFPHVPPHLPFSPVIRARLDDPRLELAVDRTADPAPAPEPAPAPAPAPAP